jgi:hypothetical protein
MTTTNQDNRGSNNQPLEEVFPTASTLLRFANKHNINNTEVSKQKRQLKKETSEQAKKLTSATKKESARQAQLKKARDSKKV